MLIAPSPNPVGSRYKSNLLHIKYNHKLLVHVTSKTIAWAAFSPQNSLANHPPCYALDGCTQRRRWSLGSRGRLVHAPTKPNQTTTIAPKMARTPNYLHYLVLSSPTSTLDKSDKGGGLPKYPTKPNTHRRQNDGCCGENTPIIITDNNSVSIS